MLAACAADLAADLAAPRACDPLAAQVAERAFRVAVTAAVAGLEVGDRNLITFHHGRGLTLAQLAAIYLTPPAALARQLARIEDRLRRTIRRALVASPALGAGDPGLRSRVLALADTRLAHALRAVLRKDP